MCSGSKLLSVFARLFSAITHAKTAEGLMLDGSQSHVHDARERYALCSMTVHLSRHADGDPDVANRLAIAIRSICEDYTDFIANLCSPELVVDFDHVGNDRGYCYKYMIRILDNQDKFKAYHDILRHVIATLSTMIEAEKNKKPFGHFDATGYFVKKLKDFPCRDINDKDIKILKNIENDFERNVLSHVGCYGIIINLDIKQEVKMKHDDQIDIPFVDVPEVLEDPPPDNGPSIGSGDEGVSMDLPGSPVEKAKDPPKTPPKPKPIPDNTVFLARLDFLALRHNTPSIWTVGSKSQRLFITSEARAKIESNLEDYRGKWVKLCFFELTIGGYQTVTLAGMKRSF